MLFNLFTVGEPMRYFYKSPGIPITKKFMKTALVLVFRRRKLKFCVLKPSCARENLRVIKKVSCTSTLNTVNYGVCKIG